VLGRLGVVDQGVMSSGVGESVARLAIIHWVSGFGAMGLGEGEWVSSDIEWREQGRQALGQKGDGRVAFPRSEVVLASLIFPGTV
jgi:hypothetical protein